MNKSMKSMFISNAAFLIFISSNGFAADVNERMDEAAENRADRLEEKADHIRDANENTQEAIEERKENRADRLEDQADQVRESAEEKADMLEEEADEIR